MPALLTSSLRGEEDVVLARQQAQRVAAALGFDEAAQLRIACAVTEIARNAVVHGRGGRLQLSIELASAARELRVEIGDDGPRLPAFDSARGDRSVPGAGVAIARGLMDAFELEPAAAGGTRVRMRKRLVGRGPLSPDEEAALRQLAAAASESPAREYERVLIRALERLGETQRELEFLNRQLAETNRGLLVSYRTPIHSILNLAELLLNGSLAKPLPEQATALGSIRKAAQHLSELVGELLELSRSDAH